MPSIKYATFFRRTTILAAIFIAGGALTALVDQATWEKAAATLVATVIAIALMPRLWLRFGAFIVFWAGFLGFMTILNDYGHHVLYDTPLRHTDDEYSRRAIAYAVFGTASLLWWLLTRRSMRRTQ